ncbi:ornithine cyclodeaminase family protein [Halorubrum vacuolatum]|uniref:Alanine dehydrogenase n=1 Tax=Halorubrum vacuolatum TaxID=63740 RepID=A0A238WXI0_HALVU|nr:ornithine cyclodeaminase family protein [Halorubrum vacuolatum]SNR51216.1 alanine dehydrogenase [Halorubrum vacuolatum]
MYVLSDDDVAAVLDLEALLDVVADGLRAQGRGDVERPPRPHFPVGIDLDDDFEETGGRNDGSAPDGNDRALGTGLVMSAYVHGASTYATKIVGVHEGNSARGLPTVNASITLTAADTGRPLATMDGTRITNARTGCIGGLAARHLAVDGPVRVGVIGAGQQARWQTRAIAAAVPVESVRIYAPSESRERCAADLRARDIRAQTVPSAADAVRDADVIVTATTATEPVFDGQDLQPGALVVAVGAYTATTRELDDRTVERAAAIYADVPEEVAATGDFPTHDPADLLPFASVLAGDRGRERETDVIVVASVGTAVMDAVAAEDVYERAVRENVGTDVPLSGDEYGR